MNNIDHIALVIQTNKLARRLYEELHQHRVEPGYRFDSYRAHGVECEMWKLAVICQYELNDVNVHVSALSVNRKVDLYAPVEFNEDDEFDGIVK